MWKSCVDSYCDILVEIMFYYRLNNLVCLIVCMLLDRFFYCYIIVKLGYGVYKRGNGIVVGKYVFF